MNGRLQHYRVSYREQETSDHWTVISHVNNVTLSGLHPYFTYAFKVRAETVAPGPYSAEQSIQLDEDGKGLHPISMYVYVVHSAFSKNVQLLLGVLFSCLACPCIQKLYYLHGFHHHTSNEMES